MKPEEERAVESQSARGNPSHGVFRQETNLGGLPVAFLPHRNPSLPWWSPIQALTVANPT